MIFSTMQPGSGFAQAINNRSFPKFLSEHFPKPPEWGLNLRIGLNLEHELIRPIRWSHYSN